VFNSKATTSDVSLKSFEKRFKKEKLKRKKSKLSKTPSFQDKAKINSVSG
jgi:hypothetical protein